MQCLLLQLHCHVFSISRHSPPRQPLAIRRTSLTDQGRTAYDKWHQTELERWLSDHDIPYPAASDRKDLQDLVSKNWENNVVKPYNSWDTQQLQSYLSSKGHEVKKGTEKNKDSLISQVQGLWHETADQANDAYGSVQDWVFDS